MKRAAWVAVAIVTLAGAFFIGISPARTYVSQRRHINAAEQRLTVLQEQNAKLSQQVGRLHTDAEIERLAREQYNLVKPGEEAYALLPSADDPVPLAASRPAVAAKDKGFWSDVWDGITFWS